MKTDTINFSTTKSLQECVNVLRNAASQLKGDIIKLADDPFGNIGGPQPDIAIGMEGAVSVFGMKGARGWGFRVYITDLGNTRAVEMVALGDGAMTQMSGEGFFGFGDSKKRRDKVASMLA